MTASFKVDPLRRKEAKDRLFASMEAIVLETLIAFLGRTVETDRSVILNACQTHQRILHAYLLTVHAKVICYRTVLIDFCC